MLYPCLVSNPWAHIIRIEIPLSSGKTGTVFSLAVSNNSLGQPAWHWRNRPELAAAALDLGPIRKPRDLSARCGSTQNAGNAFWAARLVSRGNFRRAPGVCPIGRGYTRARPADTSHLVGLRRLPMPKGCSAPEDHSGARG